MTSTSAGTDTGRARRIGLTLALGGLLVVLDTTVTVVAVPAVVADLGSSLATVSWTTTGYLLGVVAVIPTAAWAAARVGDRRLYVGGLLAFTLFSVAAGLAPTVGLLVAARVLQGLGGGLLNPVGQAIGLRAVARGARGRMMSLLGLPVLVGPVLGPPLAGWLVDAVSWRAIFLVNVPVGIAAVAACLRWVPRGTPSPDDRPPLDLRGLALLPAGAVLAVAGATVLGDDRVPAAGALAVLAAGLLLLALFARHAVRHPSPLLALRLLRHRPTAAGVGVLVAFGAGYFGAITVLPLVVQGARGDPASLAGALSVPSALAVGVTLQVATRLVDRVRPARIVVTGTALALAGIVLLGIATASGAGYPLLVVGTVVLGAGSGMTIMPTMTVALRDLEGTDTAAAATAIALSQQLAAALGIAAVTSVLTWSFGRIGLDVAAVVGLSPGARAGLLDRLDVAAAAGYAVPAVAVAAALAVAGLSRRSS